MHKVLILGAGKIGSLICGLLADSGDYEVHVADVNGELARAVVVTESIENETEETVQEESELTEPVSGE